LKKCENDKFFLKTFSGFLEFCKENQKSVKGKNINMTSYLSFKMTSYLSSNMTSYLSVFCMRAAALSVYNMQLNFYGEDESQSDATITLTERSENSMVKNHFIRKRRMLEKASVTRTREVELADESKTWYELGMMLDLDPARSSCSELFNRKTRSPLLSPSPTLGKRSPTRMSLSCENPGN